jgi:hypothetical protein
MHICDQGQYEDHQKHFVKRRLARAKIYTFGESSTKVILQTASIYTYRSAVITAQSRTTKRKSKIRVQFMFVIPSLLSLCPCSMSQLPVYPVIPVSQCLLEPNSSADTDTKDAESACKKNQYPCQPT